MKMKQKKKKNGSFFNRQLGFLSRVCVWCVCVCGHAHVSVFVLVLCLHACVWCRSITICVYEREHERGWDGNSVFQQHCSSYFPCTCTLPNDDDELMLNVLRCHLTY